jgi:hypothetical protein
MQRTFVGHMRFGADGVAEFARGWNDTDAPKELVSELQRPSLLKNRGWFDAYATSDTTEPFAIESCQCGSRPLPRLKL